MLNKFIDFICHMIFLIIILLLYMAYIGFIKINIDNGFNLSLTDKTRVLLIKELLADDVNQGVNANIIESGNSDINNESDIKVYCNKVIDPDCKEHRTELSVK